MRREPPSPIRIKQTAGPRGIRYHFLRSRLVAAGTRIPVGNAVVFGSGRFAPSTPAGRLLIAHELSHTIQQSSPAIPLIGELATMPSGHPTECQADTAAQLVSAGGSAEHLFQEHTRALPSGEAPALQLQPEAKAPAPAPKSFREKLDGFIARKNALRSQLDTQARSLQFMTTVVGIYSNDAFKQWEPWRKEIMKIGDDASNLHEEIEKTIVDDKVIDQPGGQKLEEEAMSVAESARFIFIDATRTNVPASTTVSVIERVDTVTFVTSGVVKGKSLELQEWLDKIKADYESASKAAKGNKPAGRESRSRRWRSMCYHSGMTRGHRSLIRIWAKPMYRQCH